MIKSKKIIPAALTSLAFLMSWFVLFFSILAWYLKSFGALVVKTGIVSDVGFIITFYVIVAFFMVVFGIWFSSRFFKYDGKKRK